MHRMKGKKGAFAIKVDLAKAYDKISWEFIWRILVEINFPDALINVIMHSVSSVMTNVKWNGTRAEFFRPQRGCGGREVERYKGRKEWFDDLSSYVCG
ncbi:retrovirus-related pol polyprotein LINE-1 [Trifolium medium]|uniref:Retrovirus-related pol polyprotein LINE-1 n=1 Tax=Trifolium medium TaxID=97028 RepID=A0A392QAN2_9FABA|nr:retrovirus-related pol polyprotein LINE-1 [Trifolium medium]